VADALRRRGDVGALVIDAAGTGGPLASHLRRAGSDATAVPESGLGAAAAASELVLLEAMAMGPDGFVAMAGSRAAAAVARQEEIPVWVVAGAGRVLPALLWTALLGRLAAAGDPWEAEEEVVPVELVEQVVGPEGPASPSAVSRRVTCPAVPELTRTWAAPGSHRPGPGGPGPS
jgi:translation initiation factor 2B subunit (eIF-2B alpha/beta/delta family)